MNLSSVLRYKALSEPLAGVHGWAVADNTLASARSSEISNRRNIGPIFTKETAIEGLKIYVFVRQDIPLAQQLVDVGHAVFHMASPHGYESSDIPSLVVIGIPHPKSLARVLEKLTTEQIPHYSWQDPDFEFGVTAIATIPLGIKAREALLNYRLWRYSPGAEQSACGVTADGRANADIAQLREHFVSNGEVVGVNPSVGSNSVNCT